MPKKQNNYNNKNSASNNIKAYFSDFRESEPVRFFSENSFLKNFLVALAIILLLSYLGLLRVGPVKLSEERYLTVIGDYTSLESNRLATLTATITETNTNKETVVQSVNKKSQNLSDLIKNFGIDPQDIKTTGTSLYRIEEQPLPTNSRIIQPEKWRSSVSIEIKVRDISKLGELMTLLAGYENTEIFGPNYTIDKEALDESRMLVNAIDDAKEKAAFIAKNNDKNLGKIISIEEMGSSAVRPYAEFGGLGGGAAGPGLNPGSSEISKSVVVKFEIR